MRDELKNELKKKLLEEKEKLEKNLKEIAKKDENFEGDYDAKYENFGDEIHDQSAEAAEVSEYDKRLSLEANLETRLKEVNDALIQIEGRDYGKCKKCGVEIPEERLKANPTALLCVECGKKEKRGTYYKG